MMSSSITQQTAHTGHTQFAQGRATQEQLDHYIAEARRLRAEMFNQLVRGAYARLFRAGKAQPARTAHGTHGGAARAA